MTISRSYALPINLLLIFDMPDLNDALSLSTKLSLLSHFVYNDTKRSIVPFTTT